MKKALYLFIIIIALLMPVERLDIAKLEPVEAVAVCKEGDTLHLKTDTQAHGSGATVSEAVENLKELALSVIYLDTAEYLLVGKGAEESVEELLAWLKSSVKIHAYDGSAIREAVKYLEAHDQSGSPKTD